MNKKPLTDDPEHWRQQAEAHRKLAEQQNDPAAKDTLLEIARSFDELAVLAEKRRRPKP